MCRGGSTFEGWTELSVKRAQLLGSLERLRVRLTDEFNVDGNPIRLGDTTPTGPAQPFPALRAAGLTGRLSEPPTRAR